MIVCVKGRERARRWGWERREEREEERERGEKEERKREKGR